MNFSNQNFVPYSNPHRKLLIELWNFKFYLKKDWNYNYDEWENEKLPNILEVASHKAKLSEIWHLGVLW